MVLVYVEGSERGVHDSLVPADADADGSRHELGPANLLVAVAVKCMDHPLCGKWSHAARSQHQTQVGRAQAASVSRVEVCEQRAQLEQGLHLTLVRDQQEDGLLQLRHPCIGLDALHNTHRQCWWHIIASAEPRVLKALCRIRALGVILLQHLPQQVSTQAGDMSQPRMILHLLIANLLDGLLLPPSLITPCWGRPLSNEGEIARAHVVQDDPGTPHIHLHRHLLLKDLWRHVEQSTTDKGRILLLFVEQLSQPKINDLYRGAVLVHHHDVLRLQVFVQEGHCVHEGQCPQCLFHDIAHKGLVIRRLARLPQNIYLLLKLATIARLHDLRDILRVVKVLIHLDDVWVVQHGHVANLLQDLLACHV
mmetsp:Transcript_32764/g.90496  ORF Transcript_32764/g.90496 Transcript_32764/m.90496 type:complete len:365 (+) Transcript_32764:382-1476(+)